MQTIEIPFHPSKYLNVHNTNKRSSSLKKERGTIGGRSDNEMQIKTDLYQLGQKRLILVLLLLKKNCACHQFITR
jgi:hypothetical protein